MNPVNQFEIPAFPIEKFHWDRETNILWAETDELFPDLAPASIFSIIGHTKTIRFRWELTRDGFHEYVSYHNEIRTIVRISDRT